MARSTEPRLPQAWAASVQVRPPNRSTEWPHRSRRRLWLLIGVPMLRRGAHRRPRLIRAERRFRPGRACTGSTVGVGGGRGDTDGIRYGETLVVYNGRSHYGDEQVFARLRGGDRHRRRAARRHRSRAVRAPAPGGRRHPRRRPRDHRPGQPVARRGRRPAPGRHDARRSRRNVPAGLHDADGNWWAVTTRLRVPVVSTERVPAGAVTSYESSATPASAAAPACGRRTTSTTSRSSPT